LIEVKGAMMNDKSAIRVALLVGATAGAVGMIFGAPDAEAAPYGVYNSIYQNHLAICRALDNYGPAAVGMLGLALIKTDDDLTLRQAAEVIVQSVSTYCPWHTQDLRTFAQSN
jgi:hypothetical protein